MTKTLPMPQIRKDKIRLLLDVTISATTKLNTGIQRVVRNVAKHSESVSSELEVECTPVVCHGDQLSPVGFDGRARLDARFLRALRDGWMGCHKGIARFLSRLNHRAGPGYLATLSRLRKLLVPKTFVRGMGSLYRRLTGQTIQFKENDVLVLLDASWDLPLDHLIQAAGEKQIPVVTVVYDLIPILHPQFHQPQLREVFATWLDKVVEHSSLMIGISETVQDDLADFIQDRDCLQMHGLDHTNDGCRLDHFRLGSDFSQSDHDLAEQNQSSIPEGLNRNRYYLAVGTLEPRKNHSFLLDAFEKLWLKDLDCQLVIVGKIGWMCNEVAERILRHPLLNRKLFFFDNVTDSELNGLYENAQALVFPSIVEGFGLPIVEAFQHRLPVLASDTRIHREVAGDQASYFSLADPTHLASLIDEVEAGDRKLQQPDNPSTTWEDSCRELLGKICDFVTNENSEVDTREELNDRDKSNDGERLRERRLVA